MIKYDHALVRRAVRHERHRRQRLRLAYAHYGRGVILYDGIDRDQSANLAYQQYVAAAIAAAVPPRPAAVQPARWRRSRSPPTSELVSRTVKAGQTVTYPLTVLAAKPDYAGTVALSIAAPAGAAGLRATSIPRR